MNVTNFRRCGYPTYRNPPRAWAFSRNKRAGVLYGVPRGHRLPGRARRSPPFRGERTLGNNTGINCTASWHRGELAPVTSQTTPDVKYLRRRAISEKCWKTRSCETLSPATPHVSFSSFALPPPRNILATLSAKFKAHPQSPGIPARAAVNFRGYIRSLKERGRERKVFLPPRSAVLRI